ncbi:hypothetical protein QBC41DRAFT_219717 [Cercophora samala]|uniref:DUF4604 domain-containing protein n=1 Tax=Cercophora samala TaxID=330535 RepID=A0AA39ZHU0_9PEZI|nr:hypothetical protein QBC41DRAFT_219717 [Cercophora samala]
MPPKITAKNLQYNTTLPPFLARLRGEATSSSEFDGGSSGGPDPILAARRRPTKKRSGSAEAEDAPTIVDEHGNTVQDVTVGVDGSVKTTAPAPAEDAQEKGGHDDGDGSNPAVEDPTQAKASIGAAGKKRKVGKVIGADADEEGDQKVTNKSSKVEEKDGATSAPKPKPKKKAKKIKLSFDDDEG